MKVTATVEIEFEVPHGTDLAGAYVGVRASLFRKDGEHLDDACDCDTTGIDPDDHNPGELEPVTYDEAMAALSAVRQDRTTEGWAVTAAVAELVGDQLESLHESDDDGVFPIDWRRAARQAAGDIRDSLSAVMLRLHAAPDKTKAVP